MFWQRSLAQADVEEREWNYEVCQHHEYLKYGPLCGRSTDTEAFALAGFYIYPGLFSQCVQAQYPVPCG